MRGPSVADLLEGTRAVLDSLERHEDIVVRSAILACRCGDPGPADPRFDALAGVPKLRRRDEIERVRDEVRLFGREHARDEVERLPDTGPPFVVIVGARRPDVLPTTPPSSQTRGEGPYAEGGGRAPGTRRSRLSRHRPGREPCVHSGESAGASARQGARHSGASQPSMT